MGIAGVMASPSVPTVVTMVSSMAGRLPGVGIRSAGTADTPSPAENAHTMVG
jgi:hypothetical protein